EKMRLSAAGNLGIGTTAPSTTLHVKSASGTNGIKIENAGTASSDFAILQYKHGNSANLWQSFALSDGTFAVADLSGAGTAISVDANRNVGIGTTSPLTVLDLSSEIGRAHV